MPAETSSEYVKKCLVRLGEQLPRALYRCLETSQAEDEANLDVDGIIDGFIEIAKRHQAIVSEDEE